MTSNLLSIFNLILWLLPLFFLPLGVLCFKYLPFRRIRWIIYVTFDSIVIIANYSDISFSIDYFDWLAVLIFAFTFAELFWAFKLFRKNIFTTLWWSIGGFTIVLFSIFWFIGGLVSPVGVPKIKQITSIKGKNIIYTVKETDYSSPTHHMRQYWLTKKVNFFEVVEKDILLFGVADLDYFSKQNFKFQIKGNKVTLEVTNDDVIQERVVGYL